MSSHHPRLPNIFTIKDPFYRTLPWTSMESMYWNIMLINNKLIALINNPLFRIFFKLMKDTENDNLNSGQHRITDITTVSWYNPSQNPVRVVQSPDSGARTPGLESQLCHLSAVQLWASYATSLCLNGLICKLLVIIVPIHRVVGETKWAQIFKDVQRCPKNSKC